MRHIVVYLLILLFLLSSQCAAVAQGAAPAVVWEKTYGGDASDTAYSGLQTDDGGIVVLGVTKSSGSGGYDVDLLKLDAAGEKLWEKTYGGTGNEWVYTIQKAGDGYVIVGASSSFATGGFDAYLLRVDAAGNKLWEKTYGNSGQSAGFSVNQTGDGGFIFTGYKAVTGRSTDLSLVKTDGSGNVEWEKTYGGLKDDWGKCVRPTGDGGYIVSGWTRSFSAGGDTDMYLLKVDASGNQQWQKTYGGPKDDLGYTVMQTPDGFLAGGHTSSYGIGLSDVWIVKTGTDGTEQWNRTYGGPGNDYGTAIIPVNDGYLLGGWTDGAGFLLSKADLNGDKQWSNTYSYTVKTQGWVIIPVTGGYVVVGNTNDYGGGKDDFFVMKLKGETPAADNGLGERAAMSAAALAVGGGIGALASIGGARAQTQPDGGTPALKRKSILEKLWDFVHGFLKGQLKSLILKQESKIHKVEARQQQAFFLGISSLEWLIGGFGALALAVAYVVAKKAVLTPDLIVLYLVTACIVTGLHDFTHRYFAFKYKAVTEYQFWGLGFIAMFATAFIFGLLYGMPARTLVSNSKDLKPKELAIVYGSGPLVSFAASLVFLIVALFGGPLASVGIMGVSMNLLSATYSLMPFKNMDGNKIYSYNKLYWALAFLPVLAVYFATMVYMF